MSGLIAALERLVGERLLDRNRGSGHVELTPAGQVLLSHASVITARIQAARADIAGLDAQDVARLRVGIHQSVGVSLVPMLVSASADHLPGVDLVLQEAGNERNLQQLVAEGDLDLAFSVAPVRPGSLASTVLLRDSFVLLRPRTAAGETIDLGDRPLAAFEPCTSQRAVEERLEEHGLAPTLIIRLEDAATIHALVEGGVANALLPRLALLDSDVDLRPLSDLPSRTVVLVWQRDRTLPPEAERFIELAAQTAACARTRHLEDSLPLRRVSRTRDVRVVIQPRYYSYFLRPNCNFPCTVTVERREREASSFLSTFASRGRRLPPCGPRPGKGADEFATLPHGLCGGARDRCHVAGIRVRGGAIELERFPRRHPAAQCLGHGLRIPRSGARLRRDRLGDPLRGQHDAAQLPGQACFGGRQPARAGSGDGLPDRLQGREDVHLHGEARHEVQ